MSGTARSSRSNPGRPKGRPTYWLNLTNSPVIQSGALDCTTSSEGRIRGLKFLSSMLGFRMLECNVRHQNRQISVTVSRQRNHDNDGIIHQLKSFMHEAPLRSVYVDESLRKKSITVMFLKVPSGLTSEFLLRFRSSHYDHEPRFGLWRHRSSSPARSRPRDNYTTRPVRLTPAVQVLQRELSSCVSHNEALAKSASPVPKEPKSFYTDKEDWTTELEHSYAAKAPGKRVSFKDPLVTFMSPGCPSDSVSTPELDRRDLSLRIADARKLLVRPPSPHPCSPAAEVLTWKELPTGVKVLEKVTEVAKEAEDSPTSPSATPYSPTDPPFDPTPETSPDPEVPNDNAKEAGELSDSDDEVSQSPRKSPAVPEGSDNQEGVESVSHSGASAAPSADVLVDRGEVTQALTDLSVLAYDDPTRYMSWVTDFYRSVLPRLSTSRRSNGLRRDLTLHQIMRKVKSRSYFGKLNPTDGWHVGEFKVICESDSKGQSIGIDLLSYIPTSDTERVQEMVAGSIVLSMLCCWRIVPDREGLILCTPVLREKCGVLCPIYKAQKFGLPSEYMAISF